MRETKDGTVMSLLMLVFFGAGGAYLLFKDDLPDSVNLGLMALMFLSGAAGMIASLVNLARSRARRGYLGLVSSMVVLFVAYVFSHEMLVFFQYRGMNNALQAVCNGQALPVNPAYQESGFNPATLVGSSQGVEHYFSRALSLGWIAQQQGEAALVVCIQKSEQEIETCRYSPNGFTVKRYQSMVSARLMEAHSGTALSEQIFWGGEPAECPGAVTGSGENHGEDVAWETLQDWLDDFVHPAQ